MRLLLSIFVMIKYSQPNLKSYVSRKVPQLLRDESIEPIADVLSTVISSELYAIYQQLIKIAETELDLQSEWRYYKDGKSWLCKFVYKKKTVLWLSLWETFIKVSFYFTEKTRSGIDELEIDESLKYELKNTASIGKLLPLIIDISSEEQLKDISTIIEYKKSL